MSGGVCDLPGERCFHPISCDERGCVKQRSAPKPAPATTPPSIMSGAVEGVSLQDAVTTLDVFLAAYDSEPDDAIVNADDDLLTWGHLRTILAGLTTPPARSYADGVRDSAKVVEARIDPAFAASHEAEMLRSIAAAIRLLSQGDTA